jgi:hypothetical protein
MIFIKCFMKYLTIESDTYLNIKTILEYLFDADDKHYVH